MLVLSRKRGEGVVIGNDIHVTVLQQRGGRVRLGIQAPRSVHVGRTEQAAGACGGDVPTAALSVAAARPTPSKASTGASLKSRDEPGLAAKRSGEVHSRFADPLEKTEPDATGERVIRVLLAEDDEEMRAVLALHLRRASYQVTECPDGMALLSHLHGYFADGAPVERYDLILSDIRLPGVFATAVAEGAVDYVDFPPMILITGFGDEQTHREAERTGVRAVLNKPFEISELLDAVRNVVGRPAEELHK